MKKMTGYYLNGQLIDQLKKITGKIKEVLTGKSIQPLPSYWALIPVKVEKIKGNKIR